MKLRNYARENISRIIQQLYRYWHIVNVLDLIMNEWIFENELKDWISRLTIFLIRLRPGPCDLYAECEDQGPGDQGAGDVSLSHDWD